MWLVEAVDRSNTDISSVSFVTFNVAANFFGVIPTYGVLPYAMIHDGISSNSYTRQILESVQTKVKVVAVHQELGEVEELWNKFFHISHVCFTG